MTKWTFEPGHTAASFNVRHMMISPVRGKFGDVHGTLEFDPEDPRVCNVEVTIDAAKFDSGEQDRDDHLKAADFFDVASHPTIGFRGGKVDLHGGNDFTLNGDLTLRGITKEVALEVTFLGTWETPWWEDGVDRGPKTRAGFVATAVIDRRDFGIDWNGELAGGGVVVGNRVEITIDAEAILDDPTGTAA